jgi:hypothetical protein
MRQAQTPRAAAWLVLAVVAGAAGCTHNYYYGNAMPVCPEAATTVNSVGSVCDIPAPAVGGALQTEGPGTSLLAGTPRASRVVVSEPLDGSVPVRGGGLFGWRRTDPESSVATTVKGTLDEESTVK